MKKLLAILLLSCMPVYACTSAIITGKATKDGRPMLWKHRDSNFEENKLIYFHGKKYDFIGVANRQDSLGAEIWMGSNSAGFSIMNTMSYNVNVDGKADVPPDQEGLFMKEALSRCATLKDFEAFLNEAKGKWGIEANFGVIDAKGGAAYYETGHFSYVKYDVNDPKVAPNGYLIRTNFSFSGEKLKGYGYVRYQTAEELFSWNYMKDDISLDFVLKKADRSLKHSLLRQDLNEMPLPEDSSAQSFIPFRDYIVRNSSVSSMIVQGVRLGEDVKLTTIWTVLGFPMTTLAVPAWVAAGDRLPSVTVSVNGAPAPINEKSLILKKKCFPIEYDNGNDYLNLPVLLNKKGTGIAQKLLPKEEEIISKTSLILDEWRTKGFSKSAAESHYQWVDGYIRNVYQKEFGI